MRLMQVTQGAVRLAVLTMALALAAPAPAQQPSAAALLTAKEIVNTTGAMALFNPLIGGVVEQAKNLFLQQNPALSKDLNETAAKVRADLQPRFDELTNEVAKLYATHFTEAELKEVLAFYKTPAGKKLITEQPKIAEESLKFAQTWANALSEQVIVKIREEMKKRGHTL